MKLEDKTGDAGGCRLKAIVGVLLFEKEKKNRNYYTKNIVLTF